MFDPSITSQWYEDSLKIMTMSFKEVVDKSINEIFESYKSETTRDSNEKSILVSLV